MTGRLHTCYSPVRRSPAVKASFNPDAPRLACVRPVASVHPEPGSNSPLLYFNFLVFSFLFGSVQLSFIRSFSPGTSFFCLTSFHSSFSLVSLVLTVYLYRNYFNVRFISMPSSLNTHLRFPSKASAKLIPFFKLPKYF